MNSNSILQYKLHVHKRMQRIIPDCSTKNYKSIKARTDLQFLYKTTNE